MHPDFVEPTTLENVCSLLASGSGDSKLIAGGTAAVPALANACSHVGNVRVRNAATLGGNVAEADYASDPPTVLACLGATCTVQGLSGRRSLSLRELIADFYTATLERDEIITEVVVPAPEPGERSIYLRYLSRSSEDRPC